MVTQALKNRVEEKIAECLCKAEEVFRDRTFPMIPVRYDLRGVVAGQFCHRPAGDYFRLNETLLKENTDEYIDERTVPHEVAHYIVRKVFPGARSHGRRWQDVMSKIFGLDSSRCHNYDVTRSRVGKVYVWNCGCTDHQFGARKHNNIARKYFQRSIAKGFVITNLKCKLCRSSKFEFKGRIK